MIEEKTKKEEKIESPKEEKKERTSEKKEVKETKEVKEETKKTEIKKEKKAQVQKKRDPLLRRGKKYREVIKAIDKDKNYDLKEALGLIIKTQTTKFDSSVELHIKLGIKTDQADQNIRMVVDLPQGTGKQVRVAAIVSPQNDKAAKDGGADIVGSDDLIEKIAKGFMDFDVVIATPDMMGKFGKVGKVLGTKGLMPNPKTETVTDDPKKIVEKLKKGRVELRNDKFGIIHAAFGKVSMGEEKLEENFTAIMEALKRAKPQGSKGQFIRRISLATTMGPGLKVDVDKVLKETK